MTGLKIPEEIQMEVLELQAESEKLLYITNDKIYNHLSPSLEMTIRMLQLESAIREIEIIEKNDLSTV